MNKNKTFKNKKLIHAVYIIILFCMIFRLNGLLIYTYAINTAEENSDLDFKNVLILNSYDEGYEWSSQQSDAIVNKLKQEFDNIFIFTEYMDTKYHPESKNLDLLYQLYQAKYSKTKIDIVFTTDNDALKFAVAHREELFPDAPIVYSGVTQKSAMDILKGIENTVGVHEAYDPAGTIHAAAQINPRLKSIYVICDNSESGYNAITTISETLSGSGYELIYLNMLSFDSLIQEVSILDQSSVILLGPYSTDVNGYKIPADKFAELISKASSVPVYELTDSRMGHGIIGGALLSGSETGKDAAELGIEILKGSFVDSLDPININTMVNIYDYEQLQRFDIPIDRLPEGSRIINKPFSFWEAYRYPVIFTVLAFTILLVFLLILFWLAEKRRKAENEAKAANQEMKAIYQQLYATDEQLKYQINELSEVNEKLRLSEEKYRLVAETANDIIWDWNANNDIVSYSGSLKEVLGYDSAELSSPKHWHQCVLPEDRNFLTEKINESVRSKQDISTVEYRVIHKYGGIRWISTKAKIQFNDFGKAHKIVGAHTDITKLKEYQDRILEMAYYDELTKLPNRAYLKKYLNDDILNKPEMASAVIFFDIDDFKSINDNFSHKEGDNLLVEISKILKQLKREGDLVCRHGGDEFVMVMKHIRNRDDISECIAKLKNRLTDPISLSQGEFDISLSGGIALYPTDGQDYYALMKKADAAMYFVKNNGKNGFMFFNPDMLEGAKERIILDHRLRIAVKNLDFSLHFQPITDIAKDKITKFEALIRWSDLKIGQVPPAVFIKRAEEIGLILPIGDWVMRESCKFVSNLASIGYSDISVSINVSPIQLKQKDFVRNVRKIIKDTCARAEKLEFEITESILIDSLEKSLKTLHEIKSLGISITLDDFGKGYSSLAYLEILPISTLKIDKSFLDNYIDSERTSQIIRSIIELSHKLQISVVAEGVETKEQIGFLNENNCDLVQGYYISKPVPESDAIKLLINQIN